MPKINFKVPQLGGNRKFFVKVEKLEGLHDFRGSASWRHKYTEDGMTHALLVRVDNRGVPELTAYPYTVHDDREYVKVDFKKPLTVLFLSMEYLPEELQTIAKRSN